MWFGPDCAVCNLGIAQCCSASERASRYGREEGKEAEPSGTMFLADGSCKALQPRNLVLRLNQRTLDGERHHHSDLISILTYSVHPQSSVQ